MQIDFFKKIIIKWGFIDGFSPFMIVVFEISLLILATFLVTYLINFILKKLNKLAINTPNKVDDSFIKAMPKPLLFFIWATTFHIIINILNRQTKLNLVNFNTYFTILYLSFSILWLCFRFIESYKKIFVSKKHAAGEKIDNFTIIFLTKITKLLVVIIAAIIVMQLLKIKISGILAFGGISGIVIAFATKDIFSNMLGAMYIYINKPFTIGDWISSPDKELEGMVKNIGWKQTTIMTADQYLTYVPNSLFANIVIRNKSYQHYRKIEQSIYLRYEDMNKADKITKDITNFLNKNENINKKQIAIAFIENFKPFAVEIAIHCSTKTNNWEEYSKIKENILLKVYEIVTKHKAKLTATVPLMEIKK
jgi:MscS family membrane protein